MTIFKKESVSAALTELCMATQGVLAALTGVEAPPTAAEPFIVFKGELLAEYAWQGEAMGEDEVSEALHELGTAVELSRGNFMLPGGTDLFHTESREAIEAVVEAASARSSLDHGVAIRVEGLAALARVAVKTVRSAMNPKNANAIPVTKDGHWAWIEASEALAWLSRRNDWVPTGGRLQNTRSPLIASLVAAREAAALDIDQVGARIGRGPGLLEGYTSLESGRLAEAYLHLQPKDLEIIAQAVGLADPQQFARTVYRELALAHADSVSATQLAN